MTAERKPKKPFHEAIVERIREVCNLADEAPAASVWMALDRLGELIILLRVTKIPSQHAREVADQLAALARERRGKSYTDCLIGAVADIEVDLPPRQAQPAARASTGTVAEG
ncbi:MAG: hypothetical protein HYY50_00605 [Candidatus Kerfeldbacteria bacterium]|nr:hypothetical protein [Candidatus Kerfeldbacteria bacterium]